MTCWFCYYGWPKQIADIYDKYLPVAGDSAMHYGAAHIVWEDENFDRNSVQWCLDHFETYKHEDCSEEENEAVRCSLLELLQLPDTILEPRPDYEDAVANDEDAPIENFPPPQNMEMVAWR